MMTLDELRKVKEGVDRGEISAPPDTYYVNNHIHTTYSFSPYNPAEAVYMAWKNGLKTAGIMDHDSAGGAKEFIEAGKIIGMPVTCGIECRIDMSMTSLNGRRINILIRSLLLMLLCTEFLIRILTRLTDFLRRIGKNAISETERCAKI